MKDEDKTKKQILSELMKLRQRVAELEVSENNHKQAEKKLQKSEKKYRTLIDNIPQRIFHKDKNHVYVSCNDNYAQDLDITPDQVTGKTDFDFYSKELAEKYRADDKRIIGSGKVEELEEDYVLPDGQRFTVQTVKTPVRDEKGEINGILGIFMDITERKRSEEAFKKTKDHLDNIIESSLDVVVVSDSRGYITRVNKSFFKLTGYSEKEAIGKHITEFTPYEEGTYESTSGEMVEIKEFICDTLEVIEKKLFAEGRISNWETYYLRKDGKVVPVETNVAYLYNKEGDAIGSVGINRDISKRKEAEEKLRESEERARALLNAPADFALLVDNKGNILDCNETFSKRFNKSKDELLGSCSYDLFTPELTKSRKEYLDEVIQTGKPIRYQDKHQGMWFDNVLHPTYDKNGKVTSTAILVRDITEIKQVEEKLLEYQLKLKALASQLTLTEEKERRNFADYLHDQIGQKLFALNLKLETLKNSTSADTTAATLDESFNIIKQVIKDTRSLTFEISPPILYQLGLEAALEWLTDKTHKQYSIMVTFDDDKQEKPTDDNTKFLIFRAVSELLNNISKHAQAQKAKVSIRRDTTNIRVYVEDDGVGFIPPETFFSKSKRTGFGLFSIKERLEQLGGNLEIDSQPGRGTRATLLAQLRTTRGS